MDKLIKSLTDPEVKYRPHPFWSWNDKLHPETLAWQINQMKKVGLGGYFMHARGGLKTEYMSDEWFDCIEKCVQEGNKTGLESWCCDEEGWPSGLDSGKVTFLGDYYHVRYIECLEITHSNKDDFLDQSRLVGLYILKAYNTYQYINGNISAIFEMLAPEEKLYAIFHNSNSDYADLLNKKVVAEFIKLTYDIYYDKYKNEFGNGIVGFFTDEPQYDRLHTPWSYVLPEEFKNIYGFDITEKLICLFFNVEGYEEVRYKFWKCVNKMFVSSFGEQVHTWCKAHNCKLTGHPLLDETLRYQMAGSGGVMPLYEYMDIPGVNYLGNGQPNIMLSKQLGSVAAQLGKEQALTESFAGCGWDVTFEKLKHIAEVQFVGGANFLCQHLESYTLRGKRKRDYPPSLFYQQPWWDEYKIFNDYISRLSKLLSTGKDCADTLLIHPMGSAYIAYIKKNNNEIDILDDNFAVISKYLSMLHINYHYGDETIIGKYSKIKDNKFIVGECSYTTIFLPQMLTIENKTLDLLLEFAKCGGKVVSFAPLATRVDGEITHEGTKKLNELAAYVENILPDYEIIANYLVKNRLTSVQITSADGNANNIYYCMRQFDTCKVYFFVNMSEIETYCTQIFIDGENSAIKLRLENLASIKLNTIDYPAGIGFSLKFAPMQSHIVVVAKNNVLMDGIKAERPATIIKFKHDWKLEESDVNALTLDYCSYKTQNGEYTQPMPVLQVMDELLRLKENCNIELSYTFEVDENFSFKSCENIRLVMEETHNYEIYVNGKRVFYNGFSWWKDSSFEVIDIKDYVLKGKNEIVLKGKYFQNQKIYDVVCGNNISESEKNKLTYDTEIESIYILGDFGVYSRSSFIRTTRRAVCTDGPFFISNRITQIPGGKLIEAGFPFFTGRALLSQNLKVKKNYGERIYLAFEKPGAVVSRIFINDKEVESVAWAEYRLDITDFVKRGTNKLAIEIFTGNRNLLGPHHHPSGEALWTGPSDFGPNINITHSEWRERYCFIDTGI